MSGVVGLGTDMHTEVLPFSSSTLRLPSSAASAQRVAGRATMGGAAATTTGSGGYYPCSPGTPFIPVVLEVLSRVHSEQEASPAPAAHLAPLDLSRRATPPPPGDRDHNRVGPGAALPLISGYNWNSTGVEKCSKVLRCAQRCLEVPCVCNAGRSRQAVGRKDLALLAERRPLG